jgi:hypothetical protein
MLPAPQAVNPMLPAPGMSNLQNAIVGMVRQPKQITPMVGRGPGVV